MQYTRRLDRYRQRKTNRHVHDLRIAIRRLAANLDALKIIAPDVHCHRARSILKKQLKILGALRDSHLQTRRLKKFSRLTKDFKKLRHHLRDERAKLEHAFTKFQHDGNLAHRVAMLIEHIHVASETIASNRIMRERVQHKLHKRFLRVVRMQPRSVANGRRLHSARIALKQYCYLADVFSGYMHGMKGRGILRLKRHQEITGELHDLQIFIKRFKAWLAKKSSARKKRFRAANKSLRDQNAALSKAYVQSAGRLRGLGKRLEG